MACLAREGGWTECMGGFCFLSNMCLWELLQLALLDGSRFLLSCGVNDHCVLCYAGHVAALHMCVTTEHECPGDFWMPLPIGCGPVPIECFTEIPYMLSPEGVVRWQPQIPVCWADAHTTLGAHEAGCTPCLSHPCPAQSQVSAWCGPCKKSFPSCRSPGRSSAAILPLSTCRTSLARRLCCVPAPCCWRSAVVGGLLGCAAGAKVRDTEL